jgi:hypothetical protein
MATPTPTPKYNKNDPASDTFYYNEVKNRFFKDKEFPPETWENMGDAARNIYISMLKTASDVSTALDTVSNAASKNAPTPSPTPVPAKKTTTATPTPTGGFAYLMSPDGSTVKKVPWGEVANLIKAGWQEVDS